MTTITSTRGPIASDTHLDAALREIPVTTLEEQCAITMLENQAETQRAARESQRASQQLQREATESRVQELHEAADEKMVAGLVKAGAELGASACSAAGGDWETIGKLTSAAGNGAAAYFEAQGGHSSADAVAHEAFATRAGDSAREAGDAAISAERTADKVLERLGQILESKRRAEEAATRA